MLQIKEMSGVGMGGQPDFYGWYIDDWLDYGHCRGAPNCLTFDSPPLSKQENFYVDFVEVSSPCAILCPSVCQASLLCPLCHPTDHSCFFCLFLYPFSWSHVVASP